MLISTRNYDALHVQPVFLDQLYAFEFPKSNRNNYKHIKQNFIKLDKQLQQLCLTKLKDG